MIINPSSGGGLSPEELQEYTYLKEELYTKDDLYTKDQLYTKEEVGTNFSTKFYYNVTIPTNWIENIVEEVQQGYVQTIEVPGILASDTPVIGVVQSGLMDNDNILLENWSLISRIVSEDGSIIAYAYYDVPTVELPIQILCVR